MTGPAVVEVNKLTGITVVEVAPVAPITLEVVTGTGVSVIDPAPVIAPPAIDILIPGLRGPKGDSGDFAAGFLHTQASASSSWLVNHNLGFNPTVSVRSAGGAEIEAEVLHTSVNQTIITFSVPVTGTARFN